MTIIKNPHFRTDSQVSPTSLGVGVAIGVATMFLIHKINDIWNRSNSLPNRRATSSQEVKEVQTDELVTVKWRHETETKNVKSTIVLSGQGLNFQKITNKTNRIICDVETQTGLVMCHRPDIPCFHCDFAALEGNSLIPGEHRIQVGTNQFATWNLMLGALSLDSPQNPMNRVSLPTETQQQLAECSGINRTAFEEIWSEARSRTHDEGKDPDNPEHRTDNRFRNLYAMLTNQTAFTSNRAILKIRALFLQLLRQNDVWRSRFPPHRQT